MIEIEEANVQLISSLPDELKAMPPDQQRQMEPGDQSAALQTLANLREAIATHDALCERAYARAHSLRTGDPLDEEEDVNFDEDEDEKPAYAWNVSRDFPQIRLVLKRLTQMRLAFEEEDEKRIAAQKLAKQDTTSRLSDYRAFLDTGARRPQ